MIYSSKKYKYVIVDSHLNDVYDLQRLISKYTNYTCVGVARNREDAINLIIDQLPHLVFFEPKIVGNGAIKSSFSIIPEVYQYLNSLPQFIAMNASTSYSYEAIKNGVFDYILKPLNYFDLKKVLIRFENKQPDGSSICLKSFTEFRFLLAEDIVYLKADNNTTDFYLKDGSMVTSFKTLKYFETDLPNIFSRIHRSYIINVKYITKIHFSKFQCSLKYTNKLVPFSKSVKSRMLDIKNLWLNGDFEGFSPHIKFT
ncbi:response regulator transcription factor [bacterium AH-315-A23]|nr:response regulator transcription factor [bacterium AH-315-A23]PHS51888.1 MAG: DNA-binding response regulator [Lutibacter sp.]